MTYMPRSIVAAKPSKKHLFSWADKATRGRFKEAAVLRILVASCNGKLEACVSQERIAKALGVTDRTVRNIIKRMVASGLITCHLQYSPKTKKRVASRYVLNAAQTLELPEKNTVELPEKISGPTTTSIREVGYRDESYLLGEELEEDTGADYPPDLPTHPPFKLYGSDPLSAWCDGGVQ